MNKRGQFFSTDALIAIIIILLTVAVAYPIVKYSNYDTSVQSDIMNVLSSLKIGEINNSYVKGLINDGQITDLNKSVLEQIGEFYSVDPAKARVLASSVLNSLDIKDNIGIWYGNTLIFSKNTSSYENSKNIIVDRQIISGIREGGNVTGFSARSFLSGSSQIKYYYFGGYFGEGNISEIINYNGNLTGINLEIATNKDFSIYINDIFSGQYENSSSEFSPEKYDLNAYIGNFHTGQNTIKISGSNLYIAGGFIKISYTEPDNVLETRYYFPGIEGLINIYDGFYVPGDLSNMNIYLHYNSNSTLFLNLGNTTVFRGNSSGVDGVNTINNSQLITLFNYNDLSRKTIPIRLGIQNISYTTTYGKKDVDVFSVNDISGSMGDCAVQGTTPYCSYDCCRADGTHCQAHSTCPSGTCNNQECGACSGTRPLAANYKIIQQPICLKTKLDSAKDANNAFIDSILNYSGNRVGLKAYQTSYISSMSASLSTDATFLKNKVNTWAANGNTCICCGINAAVNDLIVNSTSGKLRTIVLMSDGLANVNCSGGGSNGAIQDAINAACNAHNNYNITVYTVGFGSDVDTSTMRAIASCGNGSYYYSDVTNLTNVYNQIASDIIQGSYNEQTVTINGTFFTKLYPDSYIEFNYTKSVIPYGFITSFEKQFYDDNYGNFNIPQDSKIIETKVVSYSGPRWTDNVKINNYSIYNLSNYGPDYTKLGDPYGISIPNSMVNSSNTVEVSTGTSPQNYTSGSSNNKIIYSIIRNMTSYNTSIYSAAQGCIWTVEFEDSTNSSLKVPQNYSGTNTCYYQSDRISVYNDNDAIDMAVLNLLKLLDIDSNGKLDTKLDENNLQVSISQISGIPYSWSTEVQIRRWD